MKALVLTLLVACGGPHGIVLWHAYNGDERTAMAWLVKEKNIRPNTPIHDFRLRDRFSDLPFLHTAAAVMLEAVLGHFYLAVLVARLVGLHIADTRRQS